MTDVRDVQNWLLSFEYPHYPATIARVGSALEGAANALVFRNPENLEKLAADPTPKMLNSLLTEAVEVILAPLEKAIDALISDLEDWLGFNPFQLFEGFEETPQNYWPPELQQRLEQAQLQDAPKKIEAFWTAHRSVLDQAEQLEAGYTTDLIYATPTMPNDLSSWTHDQLLRLQNWHPIYTALRTNLL